MAINTMQPPALETSSLPQEALNQLEAAGITLRMQTPLAPLTTLKVGGPAEYFVTVQNTTQLIRVVRWARSLNLPWFVLGGGSNMLISDAGMRGLVIHNRCRVVRVDEAPCCVVPRDDRPYLFAESGAPTAGAARISVNAGLQGFEWAISMPGTIGGAVVGNAGAYGGSIADSFEYGWMLDENDEVREFRNAEMGYAYRASTLKRVATPAAPLRAGFKPVILSANFRLPLGDVASIRARADENLQHRRRTQPNEASVGSTFINPPDDYAGRLIEAAGLKGAREGAIEVSTQHANFLINRTGTTTGKASDALALMRRIQARVAEQFGVTLEPEVQFAGEWDAQPAEGTD